MKNEAKIRTARWIAIALVIVGVRFIASGQIWDYLLGHIWLAAVLPLVGLFLLLFVRGMQYRRAQSGNSRMGGAQNAKP